MGKKNPSLPYFTASSFKYVDTFKKHKTLKLHYLPKDFLFTNQIVQRTLKRLRGKEKA